MIANIGGSPSLDGCSLSSLPTSRNGLTGSYPLSGLDATTFLRFLRLLRHAFSVISLFGIGLLVINIVYNLRYVSSHDRNTLSLLTIQNVRGSWMWPALGVSYLISE